MDNEVTQRQRIPFGGRWFVLQIVNGGEGNYSVELYEDGDVPIPCYAADFLEEIEATIEYERVLDDLAAFI